MVPLFCKSSGTSWSSGSRSTSSTSASAERKARKASSSRPTSLRCWTAGKKQHRGMINRYQNDVLCYWCLRNSSLFFWNNCLYHSIAFSMHFLKNHPISNSTWTDLHVGIPGIPHNPPPALQIVKAHIPRHRGRLHKFAHTSWRLGRQRLGFMFIFRTYWGLLWRLRNQIINHDLC